MTYKDHAQSCLQCQSVDNDGWQIGARRCDEGVKLLKKSEQESRRRAMHALRKMNAEDRERQRILGTVRAQRDNDFLQRECGIAPVTFDELGRIVPWKGLLCPKT